MHNEDKRVPALRLKGFEGEWDSVTLGKHAKYAKGSGHSKSDLTSPDTPGAYPIVLYGRLYTKYQTGIREIDTFAVPHNGAVLSLGGEVLIPSSGETEEDIARASVLQQRGAVIGGDLNIVFPAPTINSTFLALTLSNGRVSQKLASKAQGKSVVHLKKEDLWSLEIPRPSVQEQRAIAEIITTVEKLADSTVDQITTLTRFKQTMLVRMFPQGTDSVPEVRFEGFEGEWGDVRLGDVGSARSGVGFPTSEQGGTVGVPFFKVSDMNTPGNEIELIRATNYVTSAQIDRMGWTVVDQLPAMFFAKVGAAVLGNRKRLVREPFLLDNNTMAFSFDTSKLDPTFAIPFFAGIDLTKLVQVGALPSYNGAQVEAIEAMLPSLPEQHAIGTFFRNLDALINAEKEKLSTLRNLKSALLTQMFV